MDIDSLNQFCSEQFGDPREVVICMDNIFTFFLLTASLCPEEAGWDVGACLKRTQDSTMTPDCLAYISLHDVCTEDINAKCAGMAYTGDLIACLTEWNKPESLTDSCRSALPEKAPARERTMTQEEKKKAAARRK